MVAACALECVGACVRRYVLARCYVRASMHVRNAWVRASVGVCVCVRHCVRASVRACEREGLVIPSQSPPRGVWMLPREEQMLLSGPLPLHPAEPKVC